MKKNICIAFLSSFVLFGALCSLQGCSANRYSVQKTLREVEQKMKQEELELFGDSCFALRERIENIQESNLQHAGFTKDEQDELAADLVYNVPLFSARAYRVSQYLEAIGASSDLEHKCRIGYIVVMGEALSKPEVRKGGDAVIGGVYGAWLRDIVSSLTCKDRGLYDWPCSPYIPPARCKRIQQEMKEDDFSHFLKNLSAITDVVKEKEHKSKQEK